MAHTHTHIHRDRGGTVVKVLCYKSEGLYIYKRKRCSESEKCLRHDGCTYCFLLTCVYSMRLVCVSVCCCSFIYSNSYQADQRNLFPRRTEHLGLHPSLYLTSLICYYSPELASVMSNQSCLNELLRLGDTAYWHVQFPWRNIKEDHNKKHGFLFAGYSKYY